VHVDFVRTHGRIFLTEPVPVFVMSHV